MIFKNEGEARIQRITAEAMPTMDRTGEPFDIRTELSSAEKDRIHTYMETATDGPWEDFVREASATLYLDIPRLELTANQRALLFARAKAWIGNGTKGEIVQSFHLFHLALYDKDLILTQKHDTVDFLKNVLDSVMNNVSATAGQLYSVDNLLEKLLFNSNHTVAGDALQAAIEDLKNFLVAEEQFSNPFHMLESLACIRILNPDAPLNLAEKEWTMIRHIISSERVKWLKIQKDHSLTTDMYLQSLFYARVLATNDVHVDETGLHIIDAEDDVPPAAPRVESKPLPVRKNI